MRTIDLGDGRRLNLPDKLDEFTEVELIDKDGNKKKEIWGTVIAMTNGAVLELL
jgi:hypothetical protein